MNNLNDTEMETRILGVQSKMRKFGFGFLFGCLLGENLLKQTDNLSHRLQDRSISAAQGSEIGIVSKFRTSHGMRSKSMVSLLCKFLQAYCKSGPNFMSVLKILHRPQGSYDKIIYMIIFRYAYKSNQI